MNNLQISDGHHKPPQPMVPGMHGVRPRHPTMPPPQGTMPGNIRSDQQSPLRQFAPRMATGITPPTTGTSSQPQYPGPGAHSQGLPNGKIKHSLYIIDRN